MLPAGENTNRTAEDEATAGKRKRQQAMKRQHETCEACHFTLVSSVRIATILSVSFTLQEATAKEQ